MVRLKCDDAGCLGPKKMIVIIMTCHFLPHIFPTRPWKRSLKYLRYLTDGADVFVSWSMVYSPSEGSISQDNLNFFSSIFG